MGWACRGRKVVIAVIQLRRQPRVLAVLCPSQHRATHPGYATARQRRGITSASTRGWGQPRGARELRYQLPVRIPPSDVRERRATVSGNGRRSLRMRCLHGWPGIPWACSFCARGASEHPAVASSTLPRYSRVLDVWLCPGCSQRERLLSVKGGKKAGTRASNRSLRVLAMTCTSPMPARTSMKDP